MPVEDLPIEFEIRNLLSRAQLLMRQLGETGSVQDDSERQRELWNEAQRCRQRARELRSELDQIVVAKLAAAKPR